MKIKEFIKITQILAKEYKVTIDEGEGWSADIKQKHIKYKKEDVHNLPEEHILGLTLHEVAHVIYTTETELPDKNQELTHSAMNMIEDHAIEHIIGKDYPNASEILDSTRAEVLDKLISILPKLNNISDYEKSLLYASIRFEGRGFTNPFIKYEIMGQKIADLMLKNKKQILNRKKTKDILPMANEIVEMLIKEFGPVDEKAKDSMRKNSEMSTERVQSKGNEPDGTKTGGTTRTNSIKDEILKAMKAEKGGKGWDKIAKTTIEQRAKFMDAIVDKASSIGKKIRTVLKRNNAMEFGGRFRTGKLSTKRLARIKIQKDRKPFERRIVKSNQSYAFAVAADVSSSMFNSRWKETPGSYALSSLQMVGEALKIANTPRSLIIFGWNAIVLNPINKAQMLWPDIANQRNISNADDSGTHIDKAIAACTKELKSIKAERKIMVILTDGSSCEELMQREYDKAKKAGIECLGITLGDRGDGDQMDNVFGTNNIKIKDVSQTSRIGDAFIKILKDTITLSK